jgi:hypothetical protein
LTAAKYSESSCREYVTPSEETGERSTCASSDTLLPGDPDSVDEVIRRVNEDFVPTISDAPGFLAYYALDAGDGVLATVSVFEDRSGAEESIRMAKDYVNEDPATLVPVSPEIMVGKIAIYKTK